MSEVSPRPRLEREAVESLSRRINVTVLVLAALVTVMGIATLTGMSYTLFHSLRQGSDTVASREAEHDLMIAVSGQTAATIGYRQTHQAKYLALYQSTDAAVIDAENRLIQHTSGDAQQLQAIRDLQLAIRDWHVGYTTPVFSQPPSPQDGPLIMTERAEQLSSRIKASANALDDVLNDRQRHGMNQLRIVTLTCSILASLLAFTAAGILLHRRRRLQNTIVTPLRKVIAALHAVEEGAIPTEEDRPVGDAGAAPIVGQVTRLAEQLADERSRQADRAAEGERAMEIIRRLLVATRQISAIADPTIVLERSTGSFAAMAGTHEVTLWTLGHDRRTFRAQLSTVISTPTGTIRQLCEPGQDEGCAVSQAATSGLLVQQEDATGHLVAIPLIVGGECRGIVEVSRCPEALDGPTLLALELLGRHAAAALASAQLGVEADRGEARDRLTGLPSRARLDEDVANAIQGPAFDSLALVLLDLDHFHSFTTRQGQEAAQQVLVELSTLLQETVRTSDNAYRCGEDEFAVLLVGASLRAAQSFADRLRQLIASRFVASGVTASFGVAAIPDVAEDVDELVEAATASLYDAKRLGRNRVAAAAALSDELRQARSRAAEL